MQIKTLRFNLTPVRMTIMKINAGGDVGEISVATESSIEVSPKNKKESYHMTPVIPLLGIYPKA
jgi:hypothetical protein